MWVWRDDMGSGGASGGGGWRLDVSGTWVWDEPSPLERPGAGVGALRGRGGDDRVRAERREVGDRALAVLEHGGAEPTPIFHELTVDRSRRVSRRPARRERDAVHVPQPHPGSGPLPIQDPADGRGRARRGLQEVPTVPPPALDGSSSAALRLPDPELAETPEDELRRRAERRRRPQSSAVPESREEGGRHTWRREEVRTGRHALRR